MVACVIDARDSGSKIHGTVYRYVTLAIIAARGIVRYARAKNTRDSVTGTLECNILFIAARGKVFGMAECSYPPRKVCLVRMLADRPGLDVPYLFA